MPSRKFRDFAGAALALSRISLMPDMATNKEKMLSDLVTHLKLLSVI